VRAKLAATPSLPTQTDPADKTRLPRPTPRALAELARAGRTIYHLEVGQPQSSAPQAAIKTAQEQVGSDRCGYTAARGEPPLRDALAAMYQSEYSVAVSPGRIHLTPGSSGAFTVAFMAAFDVGDAVAVPASCYPCYRNLLQCYGCEVVTLAVDARYNVTAAELAAGQAARAAAGLSPIKGLILSSPANPTGAMLSPEELKGLCELCDATGVQFVSDEIYHGIVYAGAPRAACALEFSKTVILINSFSKFYSMTGWRLGWLVRRPRPTIWPLQDIRLLRGCCARINHPFTPPAHLHCPPWCNTIAQSLNSIRLPFRPLVCMLYTI